MSTTALLRELVIRSAQLPLLYPEDGPAMHLVSLLLHELASAPLGTLHLPMPSDPRLRKIAQAIMDQPADRGTMQSWARRVGLSERTLARLLTQQTGMLSLIHISQTRPGPPRLEGRASLAASWAAAS